MWSRSHRGERERERVREREREKTETNILILAIQEIELGSGLSELSTLFGHQYQSPPDSRKDNGWILYTHQPTQLYATVVY